MARNAKAPAPINGKLKLDVVSVPISSLHMAGYNPRKHDNKGIDKIIKSIEVYGWTNPILVQKDTNIVIAGHGRLKAAAKLQMKEVPVIFLEMDEATAKAYTIADNRLTEESTWDDLRLEDLMLDLDSLHFDLELTGFDLGEIEKRLVGTDGKKKNRHSLILDEADKEPSEEDDANSNPWSLEGVSTYDGIREFASNIVFPSENEWGIPGLKEDMLSTKINTETYRRDLHGGDGSNKLIAWRGGWPDEFDGAVVHFFEDDHRFEVVWNETIRMGKKLLEAGVLDVISPDFSINTDEPRCIQLWNTYRRMYVSRYWQEMGIRIIPILTYGDLKSLDYVLLGIPKHVPVLAAQFRSVMTDLAIVKIERPLLEKSLDILQPKVFMAYSTQTIFQQFEDIFVKRGIKVYRMSPQTDAIKSRRAEVAKGRKEALDRKKANKIPGSLVAAQVVGQGLEASS